LALVDTVEVKKHIIWNERPRRKIEVADRTAEN
jgi:hypothetical protein